MNEYRILSVRDEDLCACAQTVRAAFSVTAKEFGFTKENYPSSGAFINAEVLRQQKERGVHMYAAWVDNRVAGFVQLEKTGPGIYSFQKFAVLPEYQQLGLGKALIAFCRNKATVYGGKKIGLIMVDKNIQLKNFYIANGFVQIASKTDASHPFLQAVMEIQL